jgi:LysM repeat protein
MAVLLVTGGGIAAAQPLDDTGVIHMVRRGETLTSIAARYGTTVSAIVRANGLRNRNFIWSGQRLRIPVGGNRSTAPVSTRSVHIVRRGETLTYIAWRYGTTVQAIARANGLRNPNFIWVGQRLIIPGRTATQPAEPSRPTSPSTVHSGRWIEIDLSRQTLTAHEGNRVVFSTLISSGLRRTPTPVGRFAIRVKYRAQTMVGPGYRFPNVPYVMYFYGSYAIHGTYWHNNFGRPMSHGCVNMSVADAAWLYKWASIGTPVIVKR